MQPKFVLPPSLGTQQKKKAHPRSKPSSIQQRQDSPYARTTGSHRLLPPSGACPPTAPYLTYGGSGNGGTERQPLKRKLSDEIEEHYPTTHRFVGGISSKASSPGVAELSRVSQRISKPLTSSGSLSMAKLTQATPNANLGTPHVGAPLSLADRKMVAASQVSRRLVVGPTAFAVRSSQTTPQSSVISSHHPNPADTAPSQQKLLQGHDPAKYRKSSEFARNIILPVSNTEALSNSKNKKKSKYTPPLISGGYAEKLVNLMNYHRSEYSIWANATLRQDKIIGSTKPLAIVEIIEISRDHHIQCAQCHVLYSEHNKPPFDVEPPHDQAEDERHGEAYVPSPVQSKGHIEAAKSTDADIVVSTPPHLIEGLTEKATQPIGIEDTESTLHHQVERPTEDETGLVGKESAAVSLIEEEDSINGLHMDVRKMGVVSGSQGSALEGSIGGFPRSQPHWRWHELPGLCPINENKGDPTYSEHILKSSQGSDDEAVCDTESFLVRQEVPTLLKRILPEDLCPHKSPSINEHSRQGDVAGNSRIEDESIEGPPEDGNMRRTASVDSTIDDGASRLSSTEVVISTPHETAVASDSNSHRTIPGPRFSIIFSKLFNWSTLKVADKVEIHEPCREITIPGCEVPGSAVWIVERYRVISRD